MANHIPLNTIQAAAADISVLGGKVFITGDPDGFNRKKVDQITINRYRPAVASKFRLTSTVAVVANTEYSFTVEQDLTGVSGSQIVAPSKALVSVFSGSSTSATDFGVLIAAAASAVGARSGFNFTAAAHAVGNGGVDITGGATQPVVLISQPVLLTKTDTLYGSSTSVVPAISGLTIIITHGTTTDMLVGGMLYFSAWTGTGVINGRTSAQGVALPIVAIGGGTITVAVDTVTGTVITASTVKVLAQKQRGLGSQYIADNILSGGNPSVQVLAANTYHEVIVRGGAFAGTTNLQGDDSKYDKRYLIDSLASFANAELFLARIVEIRKYFGAGVTTMDPALA